MEFLDNIWVKWRFGPNSPCVVPNSPIVSVLECETSVMLSLLISGKFIKFTMWTDIMFWPDGHYRLGRSLINESKDLVYVGQHDLRIKALSKGNTKALNKGNTYLSSMRTTSYFSCMYQRVTRVNLVITITFQCSSFPYALTHVCVHRNKRSFIHSFILHMWSIKYVRTLVLIDSKINCIIILNS